MHRVALTLNPNDYLLNWRPEPGFLFLPAQSDAQIGAMVAARVGIAGQTVRATIIGAVASVRRVGRPSLPPGVELKLDPLSIPTAQFLARVARGEQVTFKERSPRLVAERPVKAIRDGSEALLHTLNISEAGTFLRWEGSLPLVGETLLLRLGDSIFSPSARAVVCWNSPGVGFPRGVGLRIAADGRAARTWRDMVAEAVRAGALAA